MNNPNKTPRLVFFSKGAPAIRMINAAPVPPSFSISRELLKHFLFSITQRLNQGTAEVLAVMYLRFNKVSRNIVLGVQAGSEMEMYCVQT